MNITSSHIQAATPYLPATGAGSDPTLLIIVVVVAAIAIVGGFFLLRRSTPK